MIALLFNAAFTAGFFSFTIKDGRLYGSLVDILNRAAPVMLLALGMTLVIATGGVDLSVGAIMAIAGAISALAVKAGQPVPVIILAALAAGLWNGALVSYLQVPPIVATLILMVSGRGVAQLLTDGQIITFENRAFEFIGRAGILALSSTTSSALVMFGLFLWFTQTSGGGLFIESTGANESACR